MNTLGQLVRTSEITPFQRDEMFALMDDYYENVTRDAFESDLDEKAWVIQIVEEESRRLLGFSTQMLLNVEVNGRPVRALFSGDTIINRESWGQQQLFKVSGWFVRSLMDAYPDEELYWFLISKGYKTYRFLPLFYHEFYPRHDGETPPRMRAVIDALAADKFSDDYDASAGIVRAGSKSACRLKPGVADITEDRLRDSHIRYFAERNPGHARGDELCCIAPLTPTNFTRAAYRAMGPQPPAEVVLS